MIKIPEEKIDELRFKVDAAIQAVIDPPKPKENPYAALVDPSFDHYTGTNNRAYYYTEAFDAVAKIPEDQRNDVRIKAAVYTRIAEIIGLGPYGLDRGLQKIQEIADPLIKIIMLREVGKRLQRETAFTLPKEARLQERPSFVRYVHDFVISKHKGPIYDPNKPIVPDEPESQEATTATATLDTRRRWWQKK